MRTPQSRSGRLVAFVTVLAVAAGGVLFAGCKQRSATAPSQPSPDAGRRGDRTAAHWRSVLSEAGVRDGRVIAAFEVVRRADYLPWELWDQERLDAPLPIGHDQTTSQPSLIALMVEALRLKPGCRVLEVGTGSGYQTAILGELCPTVASIDIIEPLATQAAAALKKQGYGHVRVRAGDGYLGWPQLAPFDGIVVSAGAAQVPSPLVEQLAPGGRMVIPVRTGQHMKLRVLTKLVDGGVTSDEWLAVRFVPLLGEHADRDRGAVPK